MLRTVFYLMGIGRMLGLGRSRAPTRGGGGTQKSGGCGCMLTAGALLLFLAFTLNYPQIGIPIFAGAVVVGIVSARVQNTSTRLPHTGSTAAAENRLAAKNARLRQKGKRP